MWNTLLFQPLVNALILFYQWFGNFGWSIIGVTGIIRTLLLPLTLPTLRSAEKMRGLAPKLEKLKKKYKDNKEKLLQAQMDLYRSAGVKPMSGLLPQIIQVVILIALYQAFRKVLGANGDGAIEKLNEILYSPLKFAQDASLNLKFFYLELTQPDRIQIAGKNLPGLFLILAAVAQFLSAKLMLPVSKKQEKIADKTPEKQDDLASAMQTQSLYIMPAMTLLIGLSFPSGLVLYWLTFSLFNLVQQFFIKKILKEKKS